MNSEILVYLRLLDEGTDCWRPVRATHLHADVYMLTETNNDPEDEKWEYQTGSWLRCKPRIFADGTAGLVAFERVNSD